MNDAETVVPPIEELIIPQFVNILVCPGVRILKLSHEVDIEDCTCEITLSLQQPKAK